jgi:hypothetical protein
LIGANSVSRRTSRIPRLPLVTQVRKPYMNSSNFQAFSLSGLICSIFFKSQYSTFLNALWYRPSVGEEEGSVSLSRSCALIIKIRILPYSNCNDPSSLRAFIWFPERSEYSTIAYLSSFVATTPTFSSGLLFGQHFKDASRLLTLVYPI